MSSFTPGPWQMSGSRGPSPEYRGHGVGPDGGDYVVVVPYNDKDHAECIANARLIAAAPDMFEALVCLVNVHIRRGPFEEPLYSSEQPNEIRSALAALAKATS